MKEYLARAESAERDLAAAREALRGRDAAALVLRNRLAASEARVIRANADMREAQAAWTALRLRDASDAVDVGAYNILVGRIDILEAADGGEVGPWKLGDVRAEMRKWFRRRRAPRASGLWSSLRSTRARAKSARAVPGVASPSIFLFFRMWTDLPGACARGLSDLSNVCF